MDDILITGETEQEHRKTLGEVLMRREEASSN